MKKNSQMGGKFFEWLKAVFFAVKRLKNPPPHVKVFYEFQTLQLKMWRLATYCESSYHYKQTQYAPNSSKWCPFLRIMMLLIIFLCKCLLMTCWFFYYLLLKSTWIQKWLVKYVWWLVTFCTASESVCIIHISFYPKYIHIYLKVIEACKYSIWYYVLYYYTTISDFVIHSYAYIAVKILISLFSSSYIFHSFLAAIYCAVMQCLSCVK